MKRRLLILNLCLALCGCGDSDKKQAWGTLERDRIVLKATASEIITAQPIREGTSVKQGELLVQLDDTQAKASLARAEAALASAKALQSKLHNGARSEDIAATRAQLDQAEAQWQQAETTLKRITTLTRQKLAGQADYDSAKTLRDSAQAEVKRTKQNLLLLTNGTRAEDLQQAAAQVAEAEANVAIEKHKLQQLSIVATRNGFLDRLPKYVGERTTLNDPLALLLAGTAPYARVYILETERVKLRIGQTLNVHVDGYKKTFAGKLRWISHDPAFTPYYGLSSQDRALLMYLAEIDLPDTAVEVPSGLPAQVDLDVDVDSAQ
ncbi:MAG TPA: hypothetical protein VN030_12565 [Cellvibrio sp.]|nr:hypothetical protein [Cellvibrio sp.]